ncbi:MAG: hypothetical protein RIA62_18060 [Cyclobacteriaceae bacterium]
MVKNSVFGILFFISFTSIAQVGNQFPLIEGENLKNEFINLPTDTKGKHTIIGIAFSKKAENDLKTWFSPAYNQFIKDPDKNSIFQIDYDVNLYFVPMFTGAKRPAYKATMEKVKKTIDRRLEPYVLFYKGKVKDYEESLGFDEKNIPYFYLLDQEGKIIYATTGRYSDRKMQEIIDQLPF